MVRLSEKVTVTPDNVIHVYTISDGRIRETKSIVSGSWEPLSPGFRGGGGNATQVTSAAYQHAAIFSEDSAAPFYAWYASYPSLFVSSLDQYLRNETVVINGRVLDYIPSATTSLPR